MNDVEKLRALLPHWIEHNSEHAEEFRRWAKAASEAQEDVLAAAAQLEAANLALESALERLGGALQLPHAHAHTHDG